MLMDPREFRRGFPFLLAAAAALAAFLSLTGRAEAATCLAVCACLTVGVRTTWGALIQRMSAPLRAIGVLVAMAFALVTLVAGYHAVNAEVSAAALAGVAAFLLRGMIPREREAA